MQVPYLSDKRTSQITTNQSELDDEVAWGSKKVTCAKVGISLMVQTTVWRWRRWVLHLVHRGCPELQKFVTATNATKNDYQIEHTNEMGRDGLQNDRGTTHEGEVHPISKRVWIPLCEGFTNLQNNTSKKRLHFSSGLSGVKLAVSEGLVDRNPPPTGLTIPRLAPAIRIQCELIPSHLFPPSSFYACSATW